MYNYNTKYIQINLSYELNKKIKPISIYKVMNEEKNTYVDNFIIYYKEEQRKIRNTLISETRKNGIEQEKLSIAKKLLATNMNITQISQITEISEEKIRKIEDTNYLVFLFVLNKIVRNMID